MGAIFPGAASGRFDADAPRAGGALTVTDPSEELLATIATTDSGIALIYQSLDALVEQFSLEDAAVVQAGEGVVPGVVADDVET